MIAVLSKRWVHILTLTSLAKVYLAAEERDEIDGI